MSEVEKLQNTGIKSGKNSEESQAEEAKYLTFWTDGELFGIPICDVVQIVGMQEITPLPDFPDYARGVINLRGSIIPVIDMRIRLKQRKHLHYCHKCSGHLPRFYCGYCRRSR